ncbi:MAG: methyltransferase domain-containing protein [Proteobacteria bacterium]|nr:methyltransferase domain-containing protein [Pseudomonadota bacterium]
MKINLGCGSTPLEGYTNIDIDTLKDLRERYPNRKFPDNIIIKNWDIFNLPIKDNSVDEIRSDCLFEHLNFKEEKKAFYEVKRVLKKGGVFHLLVPDFDDLVKSWLKAKDDWKDWYRDDDEAIEQQHWFGNYEYSYKNKWGYLTASIFGSQKGDGQYHKNCYTKAKLLAIFKKLDFEVCSQETCVWPRGNAKIIKSISKKR